MTGVWWTNRHVIGSFVADDVGTGRLRAITQVEGWSDGPPVRIGFEDRPQQPGSYDVRGFRGARIIDLVGRVEESTALAARQAADELSALGPGEVIEFTVDNSAVGPRSAMVRVSSGARLTWIGSQQFTYTIQLTAPDPIKYGPPTFASTTLEGSAGGAGLVFPLTFPLDFGLPPGITAGSVTVANSGTTAYWPRLRIDGPVPNPKVILNETGDFVRVGFTLTAGQWVDIDLGARRVLLNGQSSLAKFVTFSGNWLAVPPGGASLSWTADAADPAATLSVWSNESAWY